MELPFIILIIFVSCFMFLIIERKAYVKKLIALKNAKEYDEYFQKLDSTPAKIFVQKINRLYLKLNGYKELMNIPKVDETMDEMLKLNMNNLQKEEFYFQQCHYYILRKDQKYIDIFLKRLEELEDDKYLVVANYACDVLIKGRNDLIDEIDAQIDYLKGANLGAACYMIALQYLRLDNREQAKLYFQSASVVTMYSVYDSLTKKHLEELKDVKVASPIEG